MGVGCCFLMRTAYSKLCTLCLSPQWESRATRATPRCATGRTLCWTLTASRPSTPRPADPTITTTTTTRRACVRTSNRAWCELGLPAEGGRGTDGHSETAAPSHLKKQKQNKRTCRFWRIRGRIRVHFHMFVFWVQLKYVYFCWTSGENALKETNEETPEASLVKTTSP